MEIIFHWCEGHREHALRWVLHKIEDSYGIKKQQKED